MRHDRSDTNIYNGINAAILVTIACVAVLAAVTVLPSAAGLSAVVVHSRDVETEPLFRDVTFIKVVNPTNLGWWDRIAYRLDSRLVTDRIMRVETTESGFSFYTKGESLPVVEDMVVGKVMGNIPHLGFLVSFANSIPGKLFLIFGSAMIMLLIWARRQERQRFLACQDVTQEVKKAELARHVTKWADNRERSPQSSGEMHYRITPPPLHQAGYKGHREVVRLPQRHIQLFP